MTTSQTKVNWHEWFWTILFVLNFFGVIMLFFVLELDDQLDAIAKVLSGIWSVVSLLLVTLGWKKPENQLSLQTVLQLPPMKILNIMILMGLFATLYLKYVHTTPVVITMRNEYGDAVQEGIYVGDANFSGSLRLPHGHYAIVFSHHLYQEDGDTLGKIYVPLMPSRPIERGYRCRYKKGVLKFNIAQKNTRLEIYPAKAPVKGWTSRIYEPIGTEITLDSLPEGSYGYYATHGWSHSRRDTVQVRHRRTTEIDLRLPPIRSGIWVKVDYRGSGIERERLLQNTRFFWDRQYLDRYSGQKLEFFIPVNDYNQHLLEIKNYDEALYYGDLVSLKRPGEISIECLLESYPMFLVEFDGRTHKGADLYIDGEHRGSLDTFEGTISLPVFSGLRKLKVGDWERMIRFPTLDNYIEIP